MVYMQKNIGWEEFTYIDLTHALSPTIPHWGMKCGFQNYIQHDYADGDNEVKFRVQNFQMVAGIGTHIDAPAHCIPDGKTIADISLASLIRPAVVIDVSSKAYDRYSLSVEEIHFFEDKFGIIPQDSFVICYTGWSQYWDEPERYRNELIFPSITKEAAEYLLTRNVVGLGIDTLSPDRGDSNFPVHQLFLGAGKYIIENIANANLLRPIDDFIIALPLKIQDATEAPLRLVGVSRSR